MPSVDNYRLELQSLADADSIEAYLRVNSGLPGPRGNLELAHAFALYASRAQPAWAWHFAALDAAVAPTNTPGEFVAFCGVLALGPVAAQGDVQAADALRVHASDVRWRVREAVATALQLWADADPAAAVATARAWATGNRLEQRAAVAGLAEPRLLKLPATASTALALIDEVTATVVAAPDARSEPLRTLRQALGYAWSVVIVGAPDAGKARFAAWAQHTDPDIRWIVRENLKKARLERLDARWVADMRADLPEK